MKLPWVSRGHYEGLIANLEARAELIKAQNELIATYKQQIEELKALFNKSSNFEVVDQKEDRITLKAKPLLQPTGRGGFRAQRAARESQTVPVPSDSVQALEKRVVEQGGHIDGQPLGRSA